MNINNNTNYYNLFQLFLETNEEYCRPEFSKPVWCDKKENILGTDGSKIIILNHTLSNDLVERELGLQNKTTDLKVDKYIVNGERNKIILPNTLHSEENFIDEMVENITLVPCDECDSEGDVRWIYNGKNESYDEYYSCPVCDGSGVIDEVDKVSTGLRILNESIVINFKNAHFKINMFDTLYKAQALIGEDIYFVGESYPHNAHLFDIGKFRIVIMPIYLDEVDKNKLNEKNLIIKI